MKYKFEIICLLWSQSVSLAAFCCCICRCLADEYDSRFFFFVIGLTDDDIDNVHFCWNRFRKSCKSLSRLVDNFLASFNLTRPSNRLLLLLRGHRRRLRRSFTQSSRRRDSSQSMSVGRSFSSSSWLKTRREWPNRNKSVRPRSMGLKPHECKSVELRSHFETQIGILHLIIISKNVMKENKIVTWCFVDCFCSSAALRIQIDMQKIESKTIPVRFEMQIILKLCTGLFHIFWVLLILMSFFELFYLSEPYSQKSKKDNA